MNRKMIKFILHKTRLYNNVRSIRNKTFLRSLRREHSKIKKTGKVPYPSAFIFEPTAKCNLNCKMCFFNRKETIKKNELSSNEIKSIFDKIPYVKKMDIIGGEPTIRRDIFDMLDYFSKKGIDLHLAINGTLINKTNVGRLYNNNKIFGVGVSIDGRKKLHNKIRGMNNAFERTSTAIRLINKKIPVVIVSVIMKDNLKDLPYLVEIAHDLGLKSIYFEFERRYVKKDIEKCKKLLNLTDDAFPLVLSKSLYPEYSINELKKWMNAAEEKGKELGVNVYYYPEYFKEYLEDYYKRKFREKGVCMCKGLLMGRIDPQGNVIHCALIRKSFGNLKEKSFEEIWNSDEFREFRKRMLDNNQLPICETCLYNYRIK